MLVFDPQANYKTKRHKLFWCDCSTLPIETCISSIESKGIKILNVGLLLSGFLQSQNKDKFLGINAQEYLRNLFVEQAALSFNTTQPTIAFHNIGILFETELSLDSATFFRELSKEIVIIFLWDGIVLNDSVFLWDAGFSNIKLDFSDTLVTKINFNNEI